MRLQMEMAEKLADGFSPHAAFEAKHKQHGHDQTEEPGAARLGFPQRRLRVAVAAVHRLEVTLHAAFGKSGRSYWIPGSSPGRMSYTHAIPGTNPRTGVQRCRS